MNDYTQQMQGLQGLGSPMGQLAGGDPYLPGRGVGVSALPQQDSPLGRIANQSGALRERVMMTLKLSMEIHAQLIGHQPEMSAASNQGQKGPTAPGALNNVADTLAQTHDVMSALEATLAQIRQLVS